MVTLADSRSYESVVYYPILMQAFNMSKDIVVKMRGLKPASVYLTTINSTRTGTEMFQSRRGPDCIRGLAMKSIGSHLAEVCSLRYALQ